MTVHCSTLRTDLNRRPSPGITYRTANTIRSHITQLPTSGTDAVDRPIWARQEPRTRLRFT